MPVPQPHSEFAGQVRAFLADQLTPELRFAGQNTVGTHSDIEACRVWHRRLYQKGWIAPAWPAEYGGTGWSLKQQVLFERECAMNDAPILFAGGVRSVGPLLIEMGTPEQKEKYLPKILSGEDLWCQGFSEPGAGSDLAAVQTKAVLEGDEYVLNGSKIWTTGAHLSNRMFCLVRTKNSAKPQQGISFLLIDMDAQGLSVEPILMMNGEHEFNQVRFDDVRVPVANLVGRENEGWTAAKVLMRHARSSNTTSGHLHRAMRAVRRLQEVKPGGIEVDLFRVVHLLDIELAAFDVLEARCRETLLKSNDEGQERATASFLKTTATELHQRITEVSMLIAGPYAGVEASGALERKSELHEGALATSKCLSQRAASIYSGTNEIHRNQLFHRIEQGTALVARG
ncbi:acyl-CoA dehydrogenase family protein [Parvibaculaceae bacterium PLY_AMNH_Bact1]|nr:acyl-CoA dehydrogenase family protein [Parvibaculaceae bacterium PLY_AMNH_Bact1]